MVFVTILQMAKSHKKRKKSSSKVKKKTSKKKISAKKSKAAGKRKTTTKKVVKKKVPKQPEPQKLLTHVAPLLLENKLPIKKQKRKIPFDKYLRYFLILLIIISSIIIIALNYPQKQPKTTEESSFTFNQQIIAFKKFKLDLPGQSVYYRALDVKGYWTEWFAGGDYLSTRNDQDIRLIEVESEKVLFQQRNRKTVFDDDYQLTKKLPDLSNQQAGLIIVWPSEYPLNATGYYHLSNDDTSFTGSIVSYLTGAYSIDQVYLTIDDDTTHDLYYRSKLTNNGFLGWTTENNIAGGAPYINRIQLLQLAFRYHQESPLYLLSQAYLEKPVYYKPVYYSQKDYRWSSQLYGGYSMSMTGCGPTAIAMCLSGILNEDIYPGEVASWLYYNTWEFQRLIYGCSCKGVYLAAKHYGVHADGLDSLSKIKTALAEGKLVIGVVNFVGIYGYGTHMIALYGNNDEYAKVYDPLDGIYSIPIDYLWNNKSTDPFDARGGYLFYALY
jgi:hypothetical protein